MDLTLKVGADIEKFKSELSKVNKNLEGFQSGLTNIASSLGLAFGVQQIASFTIEVAKLAGEAKGVKAAFDRLPDSERLMSRLKDVTHNTVSELDLMKRSVQASNFEISLEALPRLLEFATLRAQQTGQSVDYLVDSIVTGIGRKSPLILDNLGISAVALKEKLGDVSIAAADVGTVANAVGEIASEKLQKMGQFTKSAATEMAGLNAEWKNFKVRVGDVVNNSGVLSFLTQLATKAIAGTSDMERLNNLVSGINRNLKTQRFPPEFNDRLAEAQDLAFKLGKELKAVNGQFQILEKTPPPPKPPPPPPVQQFRTIAVITEEIKNLEEKRAELHGADLAMANRKLQLLNEELKKLKEIGTLEDKAAAEEAARARRIAELTYSQTHRTPEEQMRDYFKGTPLDTSRIARESIVPIKNDLKIDDEIIESWRLFGLTAEEVSQSITNSIANAVSGQQSFVQSMAQMTSQVLRMYATEAITGAIKNAVAGAPPGLGVVMGGLAAAAMAGLLARVGAGVSGGGGGGGYSGPPGLLPSQARTSTQTQQSSMKLEFRTRWTGRELELAESHRRYEKKVIG